MTSPRGEREEGVTSPQPYPSEMKAAPTSCARGESTLAGPQQPSCHIPRGSSAWGKKSWGRWDHRQKEKMGPPQRNFAVTPTHLTQSQVKVRGCSELVCLARWLTHGFAVNILEVWSLFDTCPISLTNTTVLSRGGLPASGISS